MKKKYLSIPVEIWICLLIVLPTFITYLQVINHDFTTFDDKLYVTENKIVLNGLTQESIINSFKFTEKKNQTYWHPLSTISHILDYHFFGLNPAGHHLTNLLLHLSNSILLFILFNLMTKQRWHSAVVAILFALHPINVDTVAWISERKNLLSTFFLFITMIAYTVYVQKPKIYNLMAVVLFMLAGLLCKPMLVTLPFVLLLLDYWPLQRLKSFSLMAMRQNLHLIIEKMPLFFLSVLWSFLSSISMKRLEVEISIDRIPMDIRWANAIVCYIKYIIKIIWPHDLSVHYPYPKTMLPAWQIIASLMIILVITSLSFRYMKTKPWFTVGWFWYMGTLVPVIGLVQNGLWPEMADRWAYVPQLGIFIMITWGLPDLVKKLKKKKLVLTFSSIALVTIYIFATWNQITYWSSDLKLFSHALTIAPNDPTMNNNLAVELHNIKRYEEAIEHYKKALHFSPSYLICHKNFGNLLYELKQYSEAVYHLRQALRIKSDSAQTHTNLGSALFNIGQIEKAGNHFSKAIALDPSYEKAYYNKGMILTKQDSFHQAIELFKKAIQLKPDYVQAHLALGNVFVNINKLAEAIDQYKIVMKLDPSIAAAKTNLEILEKKQKKIKSAIVNIKNELATGKIDPMLYRNLGYLYEQIGNLNKAIANYQKVIQINPLSIEALKKLSMLYIMKKDYHSSIRYLKTILSVQPKPIIYYNIACLYSKLNNRAEAVSWLSKAIENGYNNWDLMSKDRDLDNIRQDYKKLLRKKNYLRK